MINILSSIVESLESFLDNIDGFGSALFVFVVSFLLLCMITLMKNLIARECKLGDWGAMALDLPIDVCSILIAIIITNYIQSPNGEIQPKNAAHGVILVVLSLLISVGCCLLKRWSLRLSYEDKRPRLFIVGIGCAILNFIVAAIWVYIIFNHICNHG